MARIERTVGRGRRLIASVTATAMLTGGLVVTSAAVAMPAGADAPSCKAAGKPWGIVPQGPEYADRVFAMGCRLFVIAFDIRCVHAGIQATKTRYGSFFKPA